MTGYRPIFLIVVMLILGLPLACQNIYGLGPIVSSPTATPTTVPTYTPTPNGVGCSGTVLYSDDFSNAATLSNYSNDVRQGSTTYQIIPTEFLVTPLNYPSGNGFLTTSAALPAASANYMVECDAQMDNHTFTGDFGIAMRGTSINGTMANYYSFLWNGNGRSDWQFVRFWNNSNFTWMASGTTTPAYVTGTVVHMKVICNGNNFMCYVNVGSGDQLVYNYTDTSNFYPTGECGLQDDFLTPSELVHFQNFKVTACP